VYGLRMEEKRIRARYGFGSRSVKWSHGVGACPELAAKGEWEVERLVEEYERLLEDNKKTEKDG